MAGGVGLLAMAPTEERNNCENQILKPCLVKGCSEPAYFVMCKAHLDNPLVDNFEIEEGCLVRPSPCLFSRSKEIQLVNALMSISPKRLKKSKLSRKRFDKLLKDALKVNNTNVVIEELQAHDDGDNTDFYSEETLIGCRSSHTFRSFKPESLKTQILIDKEAVKIFLLIHSGLFSRSINICSVDTLVLILGKGPYKDQNENRSLFGP